MTQMQTELKQRLVTAARASEHLCTPVADSLSGERAKQLHTKRGLAEKPFNVKFMSPCLNTDHTLGNSVCFLLAPGYVIHTYGDFESLFQPDSPISYNIIN